MKAKKVYESINFKRGEDPKSSLDVGLFYKVGTLVTPKYDLSIRYENDKEVIGPIKYYNGNTTPTIGYPLYVGEIFDIFQEPYDDTEYYIIQNINTGTTIDPLTKEDLDKYFTIVRN